MPACVRAPMSGEGLGKEGDRDSEADFTLSAQSPQGARTQNC